MTTVDIDFKLVGRFALGLPITLLGLYVAFWLSRSVEVVNGVSQIHYEHSFLYAGVGTALFGMLFISPKTVAEAFKYAKAGVTLQETRPSSSVPVQKDGDK